MEAFFVLISQTHNRNLSPNYVTFGDLSIDSGTFDLVPLDEENSPYSIVTSCDVFPLLVEGPIASYVQNTLVGFVAVDSSLASILGSQALIS